eukprot:SAG31_NODE_5445_length_2533_cov_10.145850_2_plen_77_part_00
MQEAPPPVLAMAPGPCCWLLQASNSELRVDRPVTIVQVANVIELLSAVKYIADLWHGYLNLVVPYLKENDEKGRLI